LILSPYHQRMEQITYILLLEYTPILVPIIYRVRNKTLVKIIAQYSVSSHYRN
jgi:hypothetical protein